MSNSDPEDWKVGLVVILMLVTFMCGMFAGGWICSNMAVNLSDFKAEAVSRGYGTWEPGEGGRAVFHWRDDEEKECVD